MSRWTDLKTLYHLTLKPIRGRSHAERMESFYAGQAAAYDDFRRRLLPGRRQMLELLPLRPGDYWVDLGAGTGSNLQYVAEQLPYLRQVDLVDLSPSLLQIAAQRCQTGGWDRIRLRCADATDYQPAQPVDVVTFSYSLTMIPDWQAALENAARILRPGGHIGVVDFYVGRANPTPDHPRHGWLTRHGWTLWFRQDHVFLSSDHLPSLARQFITCRLQEDRAKLPYLPWVRAPYYVFVGRCPAESARLTLPDGRACGRRDQGRGAVPGTRHPTDR